MLYGCMHLGGDWVRASPQKEDYRNAEELLNSLWMIGFDRFDHADIYCRGKSEMVFGAWFSQSGVDRSSVFLQSKVGIVLPENPNEPYNQPQPGHYNFSPTHLDRSLDGILERLQTNYLDCLFLHRPDMLADPEAVATCLNQFVSDGRVRQLGASNFSLHQLDLFNRYLESPLRYNQIEFNPRFSDLIACWMAPSIKQPQPFHFFQGLYEGALRSHISLQAYAPFAGGMLRDVEEYQAEKYQNMLNQTITTISREMDKPFEVVVLAWIATLAAGIEPVIGSKDIDRLKRLKAATGVTLSRTDWYRIFNAGREKGVP